MSNEYKNLLAMVIGDGHIRKTSPRIMLKHSIKQKEWVEKKRELLLEAGIKTTYKEIKQMSYGKERDFAISNGYANKTIKELRQLFYPNGEKIVNKNILIGFGFEQIAIIYQDDGRENKISHYNSMIKGIRQRVNCKSFVNRYEICSQSFDKESNLALIEMLASNGVEAKLMNVKSGNGKLIAISKAKSKVSFYEGIKPFIIDSMRYKISAKPTLSYFD